MNITTYNISNLVEIKQLFTKTFGDSEGQLEGQVIGNLVEDLMTKTSIQDLHGFIATENDKIIGSIFFSRVTFDTLDINAFILSPVAVHTAEQGKGIGQKLINFGIKDLKAKAVSLLFTYGDPNYYSKVNFEIISEDLIKAPLKLSHPEGWLAQSLVSNEIKPVAANLKCVEALDKPEYW